MGNQLIIKGSLRRAFFFGATMPITLGSIRKAIHRVHVLRWHAEERRQAFIAEKERLRNSAEIAWNAEQARRQEAELDLDGSRAAERARREQDREDERLAFLTAQLVRQTKR